MKSRNVSVTLLLILILMLGAVWFSRRQPVRKEPLARKPEQLVFSAAAICCLTDLGLHRSDAQKILATGLVLYHRSNRRAQPCPLWEVQGTGANGATYRLRIEQCGASTIVVHVERPGYNKTCGCTGNNPVPATFGN